MKYSIFNWSLVELPFWFEAIFFVQNFGEITTMRGEKIILRKVRFNPKREVRRRAT